MGERNVAKVDGSIGNCEWAVGGIIYDVGEIEDADHFAGVTEDAVEHAENVV